MRFQAGQKGHDTRQSHNKKADADDAVFAKNIASQGGFYDDYVLQFPDFYPDGTQEFNICKVVGKEGKTPTPAWAHVTNNSVSRCFGVTHKSISRGDPELDQSWHIVTGSKHYHHYCMDKLTREERWKVFEQMRRLEKSGKMDELTVDAFNESMQFSEEFRIFMQQTPDQSEDDSYE